MSSNVRHLLPQAIQLFRRGQWREAEKMFQEILAVRPREADALLPLALIYGQDKKFDEAIELLQRMLVIKPYSREALGSLGAMYAGAGRHPQAIEAFTRLLALSPQDHATIYNLAIALKANGQVVEAIDHYRKAIALKPDYVDAWFNLGNALREHKDRPAAAAAFEEALRIDPQHADACNNLGHTLNEMERPDEAIDLFRRAMTLRPFFADAMGALSNVLRDIGRIEESVTLSRFLIEKNPQDAQAHSALLFALQYLPDFTPQKFLEEHLLWAQRHAPPSTAPARLPDPAADLPDRPLRVGYVSRDFRAHSVAFFLENLLAFHDPGQVEVFCYSDVTDPDRITARFRKLAAHWRDTASLDAAQLATLIREDGIDILVDLAGHTFKTRLATFGLKPAPIQVSYLGYMHSSGVQQIDYRFVDAHTDPRGMTESLHTEELVRLPHTFACYRPPDDAPGVSPLPALARGQVTFASLSAAPKLNPPLLAGWMEILSAMPGSRLLLVGGGYSSRATRQRILDLFATRQISPERIEFRGYQKPQAYLELHHEIDLHLDTFPVGGHTITCNALWMGVPTITLAGAKYVSRLSTSVMNNLHLQELIARDGADYVERAMALAQDLPRLAALRSGMRARMLASPLMDYSAFTRNVEAAYRRMWHRWLGKESFTNPQ